MNVDLELDHSILLIFESDMCPEKIQVCSREGELDIEKDGKKLWVAGKITLPNCIQIKIHCNLPGQYLEFKQFWLGNIQFPSQTLCPISENILESGDTVFATVWDSTRLVKIKIFDKTPITYHLHWNTKLVIGN